MNKRIKNILEYFDINLLYDLIKADLIEKSDGNE
jgi:hypothetical protein